MGQYFDAEPSVTSDRRSVELTLPDLAVELVTDRGVFSADRVDAGSKLLLLDGPAPDPSNEVIVDVGCGYGPIAIATAMRNPTAQVFGIDVNERARSLCELNATALGLTNVTVLAPDEWPTGADGERTVDRIWSNPPIRIGKAALHELVATWLERLSAEGSAHFVVQKHLGADSLHKWIEGQGFRVVRRGSRKAFRLLDITRG